jgi:predicted nucleic acid-binding protein
VTFFVDSNIVVYAAADDPRSAACREIVETIATADPPALTSTAVVEEIWHVELRSGRGELNGAARRAYALFSPLLPVTDEIVERALTLDVPPTVGSNDRIHAATCLENRIRTVLSGDEGFDHVRGLRRVDPLDTRAVTRLLRA